MINITYETFYEEFNDFIRGNEIGVIDLCVPVANILVWKNNYALLLDKPESDIKKILYYSAYVVSDPGTTGYMMGDIITEKEYLENKDVLKVEMGERGLRILMDAFDTKAALRDARDKEQSCMAILDGIYNEIDNMGEDAVYDEDKLKFTEDTLNQIRSRIDLIYKYRTNPKREVINSITLFPIEIRAALREVISQAPYITRHYAQLYRRIYSRNERLKKLIDVHAPDVIIRNEKRMLQEYVDMLLVGNSHSDKPYAKWSLSDLILNRVKMV